MTLFRHIDIEGSSCHDLLVGDGRALYLLAVQDVFLDVDGLVAAVVSTDGKGLAFADGNHCLLYDGRTELIDTAARLNLLEAKSRHDVPGRHLADVLVATNACRLVSVELVHHLANALLCLARLADIVVHI